jgi:hypothetical protein
MWWVHHPQAGPATTYAPQVYGDLESSDLIFLRCEQRPIPILMLTSKLQSAGPPSNTMRVDVAFATNLPFSETTSASPIITFLPG